MTWNEFVKTVLEHGLLLSYTLEDNLYHLEVSYIRQDCSVYITSESNISLEHAVNRLIKGNSAIWKALTS